MRSGRALVAAAVVFIALPAGSSATATTQPPCWKLVLNAYYAGTLKPHMFPARCYSQSLTHLPRNNLLPCFTIGSGHHCSASLPPVTTPARPRRP
jgi:hypothetical protein